MYKQGFIDACRALGRDPVELIKTAQTNQWQHYLPQQSSGMSALTGYTFGGALPGQIAAEKYIPRGLMRMGLPKAMTMGLRSTPISYVAGDALINGPRNLLFNENGDFDWQGYTSGKNREAATLRYDKARKDLTFNPADKNFLTFNNLGNAFDVFSPVNLATSVDWKNYTDTSGVVPAMTQGYENQVNQVNNNYAKQVASRKPGGPKVKMTANREPLWATRFDKLPGRIMENIGLG